MKKHLFFLFSLSLSVGLAFPAAKDLGACLITALKNGEIAKVERALLSVQNPDIHNNDGVTLLMMASYMGRNSIIQLLLAKNANVNLATFLNKSFYFGNLLSN